MAYRNLEDAVLDLERTNQLIRIKEEVDPNLEMAAIHLRVFDHNGPAILFENIKGCRYRAVSNLFGTKERALFLFRDTIEKVRSMTALRNDPMQAMKHPFKALASLPSAFHALPKKAHAHFDKIRLSDLPQIKCWPDDGGPFVTLPLVYTEDPEKPGIKNSNLGMYRIQLAGNEYLPDKEAGLHYQLHRGIGIHQTNADRRDQPLKVSVFSGGTPALIFSGVMPLPEGLSELYFAGMLGNRRFRYFYENGHLISSDSDFVITGEIIKGMNKPEGPFGDHFGYYSLKHDFPVMNVTGVYAKKNAIWPFTVVGRPPQEDTLFGMLVHELAGDSLTYEIPGLHEVNAVDAAGVHPLLLATGSERYTPYLQETRPQELLTIANHILGTGQLSLAKYLFITNREDDPSIDTKNIPAYFKHLLERIDFKRDIHFHTNTTIDTLDYSGSGLNSGSKVVFAAAGKKRRTLGTEKPSMDLPAMFDQAQVVMPGVLSVSGPPFRSYQEAGNEIEVLADKLKDLDKFPLIILTDDASFVAENLNNFLWVTFTRSNPSHDIHGAKSFIRHKHWGCEGPLIIDARIKPHHAPPLIKDPQIEQRVDKLGERGRSLHGII